MRSAGDRFPGDRWSGGTGGPAEEIEMGALPKQKISRRRRGNRRRLHFIPDLNLVPCRSCGEKKLSHHVCPTCGVYRGRQVIQIQARRKAE